MIVGAFLSVYSAGKVVQAHPRCVPTAAACCLLLPDVLSALYLSSHHILCSRVLPACSDDEQSDHAPCELSDREGVVASFMLASGWRVCDVTPCPCAWLVLCSTLWCW